MADFLVSPSAETDWRIDRDTFERRMRERWPSARTQLVELQDATELDFDVELDSGRRISGHLQPDGQAVGMDGDIGESAELAAWFRTLVPDEQELIFWDEGYTFAIPLEPGVSAEEIERRARAAWPS